MIMFTIKRVFKDISFVALLIAIFIISFLAFKAGESIKTPPYGYYCESEGEDSDKLCKEFDAAGFVRCKSEKELKEEIAAAHLDCGIVIPEDFEERVKGGDLTEVLKLITSPETLLPELCRTQAVSVVTTIYAPYITYEGIIDAGGEVDEEEVKDTYNEMLGEEALFEFEFASAEGTARIDDSRSRNLFKGSIAILVFIAAWIGCARPAYRHARDMEKRFTFWGAVKRVMLPEILIRALAIAIVAVLTCLATGMTVLCLTTLLYTLIVVVSGIIAVMILPDSWLLIITVFVMILSLGLCPIFTDLAEVVPTLGTIRKGLLPYLMWVL